MKLLKITEEVEKALVGCMHAALKSAGWEVYQMVKLIEGSVESHQHQEKTE